MHNDDSRDGMAGLMAIGATVFFAVGLVSGVAVGWFIFG